MAAAATAKPPAVDVSKLSEEERKFYEKFGKLPKPKPSPMAGKKEKQVFDSAEFFMNGNKPGAAAQPRAKANPLLPGQRKAPPPRVHVTINTTENTWKDETDEMQAPDSPAHDPAADRGGVEG